LHRSPMEKQAEIISPEIGNFTSDFDPGDWKPSYPSVMFSNMTDLDAYWAMRVILSFSEADLRAIIETARYSDPKTNDYILQTFLKRRELLARYWLGKVDGLSDFSLKRSGNGLTIAFRDLVLDSKAGDLSSYTYQIKTAGYESSKKTVTRHEIFI